MQEGVRLLADSFGLTGRRRCQGGSVELPGESGVSIRILIADGHEMVLEGLGAVLENEPDMELVGRARDGREAVRSAMELEPDVIVTGVSLPGLNGIEATRRIIAERPRIKVLCLSMHRERQYASAALEAGAAGYLLKDRASDRLIEAIRCVVGGGVYFSPEVRRGFE